MAAITFGTSLEVENLENGAECYEVAFQTGHVVGMIVKPDGTVTGAATDVVGGIIIRKGSADGPKTLILTKGIVSGIAGAGAAANAEIFLSAANAAADTEPAGVVFVTELGQCISATRALIRITRYQGS